jgi:hypothetical protein
MSAMPSTFKTLELGDYDFGPRCTHRFILRLMDRIDTLVLGIPMDGNDPFRKLVIPGELEFHKGHIKHLTLLGYASSSNEMNCISGVLSIFTEMDTLCICVQKGLVVPRMPHTKILRVSVLAEAGWEVLKGILIDGKLPSLETLEIRVDFWYKYGLSSTHAAQVRDICAGTGVRVETTICDIQDPLLKTSPRHYRC